MVGFLLVSMWWLEEEFFFGNLIVGFLGVNTVNDNVNIWTGLIVYCTWWADPGTRQGPISSFASSTSYSCGPEQRIWFWREVRKLWLREEFEGLWEHPVFCLKDATALLRSSFLVLGIGCFGQPHRGSTASFVVIVSPKLRWGARCALMYYRKERKKNPTQGKWRNKIERLGKYK